MPFGVHVWYEDNQPASTRKLILDKCWPREVLSNSSDRLAVRLANCPMAGVPLSGYPFREWSQDNRVAVSPET